MGETSLWRLDKEDHPPGCSYRTYYQGSYTSDDPVTLSRVVVKRRSELLQEAAVPRLACHPRGYPATARCARQPDSLLSQHTSDLP